MRKGDIILKDYYSLPEVAGIYSIKSPRSDRCYVGSSKNIRARIARHLYSLRRGKHHAPSLQRAFMSYGEDLVVKILCKIEDVSKLVSAEQKYIDKLNSCYNGSIIAIASTQDPKVAAKLSNSLTEYFSDPEAREKARETNLQYFSNPKNRRRHSKRMKEYWDDEDNRQKHSDIMKDWHANHPEAAQHHSIIMKGHKQSLKTRRRRSVSLKKAHAENPREVSKESCQRMSEAQIKHFSDPKVRRKMSRKLKDYYQDNAEKVLNNLKTGKSKYWNSDDAWTKEAHQLRSINTKNGWETRRKLYGKSGRASN